MTFTGRITSLGGGSSFLPQAARMRAQPVTNPTKSVPIAWRLESNGFF
jgi:hypothetical protein